MHADYYTTEIINVNGDFVGSPATPACESGQVWKEAAVAGKVCAGMLLARSPPYLSNAISLALILFSDINQAGFLKEYC